MGTLAVLILLAMGLAGCANTIDANLNAVYAPADRPTVGSGTRALHDSLFIADLHADTMLWDRNLLEKSNFGHVDLPRLMDGNVALQVFAVVTKTPRKTEAPPDARLINPKANRCLSPRGLNTTGWLQIAQLRPLEAWFDLHARAHHQIARLKRFVRQSQDRHENDPDAPYLKLIRTKADLRRLVGKRAAGEPVVGALLAVEGAHWIGGDGLAVEKGVDELFEAGVRMVAPTHRFDNALGASSEGCDQRAGLSPDGRRFLKRAEDRGMIVDLAHATDRGISQGTLERDGPVVISHTGVRSRCAKADIRGDCVYERNMRAEEIRDVARTGGVIGIGYWPQAVDHGIASIAHAFHAAYEALSTPDFAAAMKAEHGHYDPFDHLALGSDFDGAVKTPFHVGDLQELTAALRRVPEPAGVPTFDPAALRRIFGANVCRVFARRLPDGGATAPARAICESLPAGRNEMADTSHGVAARAERAPTTPPHGSGVHDREGETAP